MTFSYNPALPTSKDRVRFHVGDRSTPGHLLEDEEILAMLVTQPSPALAAAQLCETLAATYARKVDKAIGQTRISHGQAFAHFKEMARNLREGGGAADGTGVMTAAPMSVGGISVDKRDDLRGGDSDRIQPSFRLGQDDNPDTDDDEVEDT